MEEGAFGNRLYSYMFYAMAGASLVISIFFYNVVLFVASTILVFLSALYYSSGHIINNFLLKRSAIIEVYNGYRLSDTVSSAVKKAGSMYKAISISDISINRGVRISSAEMLSLIEGIGDPFEFSVCVREVNKRAFIEGLETKRRMREISLARLAAGSYDKANELKRELEIFDREIDGIKGSGKALDVSIRIRTIAISADEVEAARASLTSLTHVSDAFSTMLNAEYRIISGEDLLSSLS